MAINNVSPEEQEATVMTNALHQMTMSYSPVEDRLLLRVSTTDHAEHRVWLTRRFVQALWPALIKGVEKQALPPQAATMDSPKAKTAAVAMQHHEALQKADMSKMHDEEKVNKPSTEQPMLATGGQCIPLKEGGAQLTLKMQQGLQVGLHLNQRFLHAFCHQIQALTLKAEWGLQFTVGDPNVVAAEDDHAVH